MPAPSSLPKFVRGGIVVNSVLLTILLVVVTALTVAFVIVRVITIQIEHAADRRLVDGATFLRDILEHRDQDLSAVASWLAADPVFRLAVAENHTEAAGERAELVLKLVSIDEVLVADVNGDVILRRRIDSAFTGGENLGQSNAFRQAISGETVHGIDYSGGEFLRQEFFIPLRRHETGSIEGALRVAAFLDQSDLAHFLDRTGLDASVFFGESQVITTRRSPTGGLITDVGPDPTILKSVLESGREIFAWRTLPAGEARSYNVPLHGPVGNRVGMLSVAIPTSAIAGEWQDAVLPILPVTVVIICIAAILSYTLSRRVREPIVALSAAARRLRDGDLSTPIPVVGEATIAPLAEELEHARTSMRARFRTIAMEEARQRALFAALREPIIVTSAQGLITNFNDVAAELFGSLGTLEGRPVHEVLPFAGDIAQETRDTTTWRGAIAIAKGRTLDLEVTRTTMDAGLLPAGFVFVIHDVTHHTELNRLREQLLLDVAHELRGPLGVLDNALEILADEHGQMSATEVQHLLRAARRTAARLRGLMEDMLSAGSIQSGRVSLRFEPTNLSALVEEAMETTESMINARGQRVECDLLVASVFVLADSRYARQALANLLSNASKNSPEGEVIRIRAEEAGSQVRITVEDQGPGIARADQSGLFERFYRAKLNGDRPGTGLGLAIAKGIVEAHGGAIGIDSEEGGGTRAWFTLPSASVSTRQ